MTKTEVKEYLENYNDRRMVAEYKRSHGESDSKAVVLYDAINECIENLPSEFSQIVKMHYMHRVSLRTLAKQFFLDRSTITSRRDKAIAIIADCLNAL